VLHRPPGNGGRDQQPDEGQRREAVVRQQPCKQRRGAWHQIDIRAGLGGGVAGQHRDDHADGGGHEAVGGEPGNHALTTSHGQGGIGRERQVASRAHLRPEAWGE